jgi:glycine hydroxymethyltransferase
VFKLVDLKKRVIELTKNEDIWREHECVNLIASENTMSPLARKLYNSSFMHRYAEGLPRKRYYQGTKYIDEIEEELINLANKLFKSKQCDPRPISGGNANMAAFSALGEIGDILMAPSVPAGVHISHESFGCAGIRGLKVTHYPYDMENS